MTSPVDKLFIHVASPYHNKRGTVIVLDMNDEDEARAVAKLLADETGRCVTVRDSQMSVVEVIPAVSLN